MNTFSELPSRYNTVAFDLKLNADLIDAVVNCGEELPLNSDAAITLRKHVSERFMDADNDTRRRVIDELFGSWHKERLARGAILLQNRYTERRKSTKAAAADSVELGIMLGIHEVAPNWLNICSDKDNGAQRFYAALAAFGDVFAERQLKAVIISNARP